MKNKFLKITVAGFILFVSSFVNVAHAELISLQNSTSTAEQSGWPVYKTIDGVTSGNNGWALCVTTGCGAVPEAAAWQTVAPLSATSLTFDLYFGCPGCSTGHKFQDMQWSYTTSANPTSASNAVWSVLTPTTADANFATMSILGDHVLASGNQSNGDLYSVTMDALSLNGITGFKLDLFLGPNNRIGFSDNSNGNIVLAEFQVTSNESVAVPEPSTIAIFALGLMGLVSRRFKKQA
jgi:hypothetical protein